MKNIQKEFLLIFAGIILYAVGVVLVMAIFVPYGKYIAFSAYMVWWLLSLYLAKRLYPELKQIIAKVFSLYTILILFVLALVYIFIFQVNAEKVVFSMVAGITFVCFMYGLFGAWVYRHWEIKSRT